MGHLSLHLGDEVSLGLVGSQAGNAFEQFRLAALDGLDLFLFLVQLCMLLGQQFFLLLDRIGFAVEIFLFLLQPALLLLQVRPALFHFLLIFAALLENVLLGFHHRFALLIFSAFDGFVDNASRFFLRTGDFLFCNRLSAVPTEKGANNERYDCNHDRNHDRRHTNVAHFFLLNPINIPAQTAPPTDKTMPCMAQPVSVSENNQGL